MADHGEHFGGVATGTENNENVGGGGAGRGRGAARWEDMEDAELEEVSRVGGSWGV